MLTICFLFHSQDDYALALQLHRDINGDEADLLLEAQRKRDTIETDQACAERFPKVIQTPNFPSVVRKRYPWQVPFSEAASSSISYYPQASSSTHNNQLYVPTTSFNAPPNTSSAAASQQSPLPRVLNHSSQAAGGSGLKDAVSRKTIKRPLETGSKLLVAPFNNQAGPSTSSKVPIAIPIQVGQVSSLHTKRTSPDEYHIPSLNAFLNLDEAQGDWKVVDVEPYSGLFVPIRYHYFRDVVRYNFSWNNEAFIDGNELTNFIINPTTRTVCFNNKTLLKCSRGDLVNTIFHALIHVAVYETSRSSVKVINCHDANFFAIMQHFNEKLDLQIGTSHTFLHSSEEDKEFYQCQGLCAGYFNFIGVIKCPKNGEVPPIIAKAHRRCKGRFHKVYESFRTINNNPEVSYLVHKNFADLKALPPADGHVNHQGTTIKPRELVDITEDSEPAPKVVKMTPLINLEDNNQQGKIRKIVKFFKEQFFPKDLFERCPFCKRSLLKYGGLRRHLDLCLS